jgi:hypothetical protein
VAETQPQGSCHSALSSSASCYKSVGESGWVTVSEGSQEAEKKMDGEGGEEVWRRPSRKGHAIRR